MFDLFKKRKSEPGLSPQEFSTQILQMFVKYCTKKGYLEGNYPFVPEVATWANTVPLRALKNRNIVTLSKGNAKLFYMLASSLSFSYGSYMVYMWESNFNEFTSTDYKIDGFEEDYETAIDLMMLDLSDDDEEFGDFFEDLLEILTQNIALFGNISDEVYKNYIFAGIQAFYLLGMSVKLHSIGYK